MKKPLIIFDIDGTISNTTRIDDRCLKETYKELYGLDLGEMDWSDFPHATDWGLTENVLREKLKIENWREEFEKVHDYFIHKLSEFRHNQPEEFMAVPGSVDMINSLLKEEYNVGIATGAWKGSAEIKLNAVGLDFSSIPWANSNDHYDRGVITKTSLDRCIEFYKEDYRMNEVIYFGDGEWDFKTTNALGTGFIGVDVLRNDKLNELGQELIIHDYLDISEVMKMIKSIK